MRIIFFLLLSCLFLIGCKQEEDTQNCSDQYLANYNAMISSYREVYRPEATATDLAELKQSLEIFLSNHSNVNCLLDGEEVNNTAEVTELLDELENKGSTFVDKVVYGVDNRVEANDSPYSNWAVSTAAQIPSYSIDSSNHLLGDSLGESFGLCSTERFYDQITPARCSGFLVASDIIVTAGHCVSSVSDCYDNRWVFNFRNTTNQLEEDDIYSCVEIISQKTEYNGADFAVIRLDRAVTGIAPLSFRTDGKISDGAQLVVIGHPSGLPAKVADGAWVRKNEATDYFVANLDTFGGNSGSAVINVASGLVEGILVRGETDYIWSTDSTTGKSCRKVYTCSDSACRGEDVTRITSVTGLPTISTDGGWSDWGGWSECINGQQQRQRSCNNPVPTGDGAGCVGNATESRQCLALSNQEIIENIFSDTNERLFTQYGLIPFFGYEVNSYLLLGRKFLKLCGMHIVKKDNGEWINYYIDECQEQNYVMIDQFREIIQ